MSQHARPSGLMRSSQLHESRLRDTLLVALSLASGAVDAISWLALGKVFSAFMTGNLAFLGFAIAGAPDAPPAGRSLIALLAFGGGAALAAKTVTPAGVSLVWPRHVTEALIVVFGLQAAFAAIWLVAGPHPAPRLQDALIAFSSLAMGVQTYAVLSLGVRASFTTAATATWVVLWGDLARAADAGGGPQEIRRLITVILGVAAGAAIGGLLATHAPVWAPLFPLVLTALVVCTAWARFSAAPDRGA